MAILIEDKNVMFLHIPKTGGRWVTEAIKRLDLKCVEVGLMHGYINPSHDRYKYKDKTLAEWANECFVFSFVRHPFEWHRSYWAYTMGVRSVNKKNGLEFWEKFEPNEVWHPTHGICDCASSEFELYLRKVIHKHRGFVTNMFNRYLYRPNGKRIDYVGKQENLEEDFMFVLETNNILYDRDKILGINRVGGSKHRLKKRTEIWDNSTKEEIVRANHPIIKEFYK